MNKNFTEDQQKVIEALLEKSYRKMEPQKSPSATTYMTNSGIEFQWLHGLGDGKNVKVQGRLQPKWFAKLVRKGIDKNE